LNVFLAQKVICLVESEGMYVNQSDKWA